ncbi:UNVERIFIED_CONTAM: hypothetical protein Sradi_5644500 [Sesamum radiatum]|uniref:Uncharacterized protein n=1 Tax=Sesamum radiatum TaxID=300843 RepID=A0AAW2KZN3_SESRA
MPRSSRHKSHKQSKHSSKDYSDSDEDVIKMKEKGGKDDNAVRVHRGSASGEKRKISSQVRESKDSKDLSGNGDVLEAYVSSKRRKEKTDVGGDRWNGGGDDRGDGDRNMEREMHKGESLKVDTKSKENSNKGENMRIESKSKRHESGIAGERKEDSLASVLVDKEDGKSKGEVKRKSDRDSSAHREGKESKDKDRRLDKEKNVGPESKSGDAEDVVKKQGTQWGDFSEERQGKRSRENTERTSQDESQNPELDKEIEKRIRKKREGSSEKEKHYDDFKEGDERRLSSRDSHKDDRRRDEKYREDADKDNKHHNDKYREDGEKDARRRDDRYRENGDRDTRRKDEKHREDGERDGRRKDDKYREGVERESKRDDKYHEDGDWDNRRKDSRYAEDGDRDIRRGDEKYYEDGDRDDRRKDNIYRDEDDRENRHKEEKFHEDIDRDIRHKDSKQGDGLDRDKRHRDAKHRDERTTRDRSGDKSDPKRSRDDAYSADRHARKSSAYDDSPTHEDRTTRYRDDQDRRRTNEKEDYGDIRSRGTKDQRSDAEKKSARVDLPIDRLVDKSPSSGTDRRQFGRPDVRRSIDVEESTQRSGGSRDWRGYSGKEGKGSRELGMDVVPGEELLQGDADTLSVSSPFMRNSHFSSGSKSFLPPPPFRTGVDSPLLGSAEEDGRVMQPFPAPPMFGVRPSMELNHPAPYHIPDADRFSGPGRPMGWHNQVDDSCPPLHGWDASNALYGEDSHIYGRLDWDQSRNMARGQGWETSSDLFKGPNRSASMEMLSSEKENNSTRSGDEALATQSIPPAQSEQTLADQQADSTDISQSIKSFEKNDSEVPLISQEDTSDVAKMSGKDDVPLCHVYLSKLDISADLTEPELFNKCTSLIDLDQSISSDGDDSSILCMEATEANMVPHRPTSYALFVSTDDSIFQKAISLYKMQKENLWAEDGEKLKVLSKLVPNSDQGDQNAKDDKTEKLCRTDDKQGVEDALPNFETEADHKNSLQEGQMEPDVKEKPLCVGSVEESDSPLPSEVKVALMESGSNNDELKFVDTRCSALVNSDDVSSEACEAMMPESIVWVLSAVTLVPSLLKWYGC